MSFRLYTSFGCTTQPTVTLKDNTASINGAGVKLLVEHVGSLDVAIYVDTQGNQVGFGKGDFTVRLRKDGGVITGLLGAMREAGFKPGVYTLELSSLAPVVARVRARRAS